MSNHKIGIVVSSSRPTRIGHQVAQWVRSLAPEGVEADIIDLAEVDLPFLAEPEQPATGNYSMPSTVAWSERVRSYDALILTVPEYNAGYPAVLKNAIDTLHAEWNGVPIGVIAAVRQNSVIDRLTMGLNFVGLSLPSFWQGIMLILFFSVTLGWLPSLGRINYEYTPQHITGLMTLDALLTLDGPAFWNALKHLILPALTAGTAYSAVIARVVRSSMLEVLRQDYIRTAKSKGLKFSRIVFVHALRNALIPMITIAGLEAGSLLSGSVVLETVFSWPGLGRLLVDGIYARDYPLVQSTVIVLCVMYVLISFFVDLFYSVIDPRIRW